MSNTNEARRSLRALAITVPAPVYDDVVRIFTPIIDDAAGLAAVKACLANPGRSDHATLQHIRDVLDEATWETCSHPRAAFTIGGPEDSDGYVWCPDCRTNLTDEATRDTPDESLPAWRHTDPEVGWPL